jgi:hypothetical protein
MAFAQSMRASVQARPTSSRSRAGVRAVALVRRENAQAEKKKKRSLAFFARRWPPEKNRRTNRFPISRQLALPWQLLFLFSIAS